MLRKGKHRDDRGIGLRPQFQVRILRGPASQRGIMLRDGLKNVCACSTRRIGVLMVLEDVRLNLLQQGWKSPGCQNQAR